MRWFWLFIALLAVLTGVLYTQRIRSERAQQAAMQAQAEAAAPSTTQRRSRDRSRAADPTPEQPADAITPTATPQAEQPTDQPTELALEEAIEESIEEPTAQAVEQDQTEAQPESPADPKPNAFDPGALIARFNELDDRTQPEGSTEPTPQPATAQATENQEPQTTQNAAAIEQALAQAAGQSKQEQESEPAPAPAQAEAPGFELRADGSFKIIEANIWVQGAGTAAEPYVLEWDALKSIENSYDPKNGQDKLPDWLDHLDGKFVSIEGNTLVPVVATTTRELLVMKNPWDGCCIGVPPTPYDAVEVVLNHDVDFGNSAVGYGSVQGTFYLDPYIVDGWVLGLYIVEDAKYRSGEGVVFPEF